MSHIEKYPMDLHPSVDPKIRSHVPGYCGYIPGTRSENLFGKTYGNISTETPIRDIKPEFTTTNLKNSLNIKESIGQASNSGFWKDEKNLHAFDRTDQPSVIKCSLMKDKFVPTKMTDLTYEEALTRKI